MVIDIGRSRVKEDRNIAARAKIEDNNYCNFCGFWKATLGIMWAYYGESIDILDRVSTL